MMPFICAEYDISQLVSQVLRNALRHQTQRLPHAIIVHEYGDSTVHFLVIAVSEWVRPRRYEEHEVVPVRREVRRLLGIHGDHS